jgi:hypothetical protein
MSKAYNTISASEMRTSAILAFLSLAALSAGAPITIKNHSCGRIYVAVSVTNSETGSNAYYPIEAEGSGVWSRTGPNETAFVAREDVTGAVVEAYYVHPYGTLDIYGCNRSLRDEWKVGDVV